MKFETIKSILLVVLVTISIFLTWSTWKYKPDLDVSDKPQTHQMQIAELREPAELIMPIRLLYHIDGEHYGSVKAYDIKNLIGQISRWNLFRIEGPRTLSNEEIATLSQSNNRIEIMYPDLVPFDIYKSIINIQSDDVPRASFNRIVINLDYKGQDAAAIYFISTIDGRVFESNIDPERITQLIQYTRDNKKEFDQYEAVELADGRIRFLLSEEKELKRYKYYTNNIDVSKFQEVLFSDPDKVRRDFVKTGEKFTDDSSFMNVDYMSNMISYVYPGNELKTEDILRNNDILKKSIDYINEHKGWTDNYRYFNIGEYDQRVSFQLFMDDYPVFNDKGMTQFRLSWGAEGIFKYNRPYFSFDIDLPGELIIKLPSGTTVLDYLMTDPDFKPELMQDLMIGYRLGKDPNNAQVYTLEPSWYYLYAGSWLPVDPIDIRGKFNGLE
ncbi:MAG TPA: two-component system activity regulator YycH [Bacillaceae bacterium]|nr:two-component system activity regulator YycH [Paenibacillus bovis]HLU23662.1 two-component system activity regulator YycH [Bacillaceae bacterium]